MAIKSSGILNADAAVTSKNSGFLHGIALLAAAADCYVKVYDGDASGDIATAKGLAQLKLDIDVDGVTGLQWFGDKGIRYTDGLYVDVDGAGATYIVYYS